MQVRSEERQVTLSRATVLGGAVAVLAGALLVSCGGRPTVADVVAVARSFVPVIWALEGDVVWQVTQLPPPGVPSPL